MDRASLHESSSNGPGDVRPFLSVVELRPGPGDLVHELEDTAQTENQDPRTWQPRDLDDKRDSSISRSPDRTTFRPRR